MTSLWAYDPWCPCCGAYAEWLCNGVPVCWDHLPASARRRLRRQARKGRN